MRSALWSAGRARELVVFALFGGVPEPLARDGPDWTKIVGQDPDSFNFSGIDPHMIQSTVPRPGLSGPFATPTGAIHGREWNTTKGDLQYACTFPLPTPKACATDDQACDCSPTSTVNPPLCGAESGQQVRAKAYPTTRPLRVVRGLGQRGVVGSICSRSYDITMKSLALRLATRLAR